MSIHWIRLQDLLFMSRLPKPPDQVSRPLKKKYYLIWSYNRITGCKTCIVTICIIRYRDFTVPLDFMLSRIAANAVAVNLPFSARFIITLYLLGRSPFRTSFSFLSLFLAFFLSLVYFLLSIMINLKHLSSWWLLPT